MVAGTLKEKLGCDFSFGAEFSNPRLIETHVSLVVIGHSLVLKFKKPVNLGFVDHTCFSSRWRSACNEITLNARLSDGIYLGLYLARSGEQFHLDEEPLRKGLITSFDPEEPPPQGMEVAVVMNRIDTGHCLDRLIAAGRVEPERHIRPAAERIARFHQRQMRFSAPDPEMHPQFAAACRENIAALHKHRDRLSPASADALERIGAYMEDFLEEHSALFDARINARHFVDGHGDLRAEHICFVGDKVQIIDCVEFSAALRTVDILCDAAFLAMDLDAIGRPDLSAEFIEYYAEAVGEHFTADLFYFYCCYRAMVRAKVAVLRASELQGEQRTAEVEHAEEYLSLAAKYALGLTKPFLLLIGGLMGSGKSTLARCLNKLSHARVVRSDIVRKLIYGSEPEDRTIGFGREKYSAEATTHTYRALLRCAEGELVHGRSVIVDASFTACEHRKVFADYAKQADLPCALLWCTLEKEQALQRLAQRSAEGVDVSDGRAELYDAQRAASEPPKSSERQPLLVLDTSLPLAANISEAVAFLQELLAA